MGLKWWGHDSVWEFCPGNLPKWVRGLPRGISLSPAPTPSQQQLSIRASIIRSYIHCQSKRASHFSWRVTLATTAFHSRSFSVSIRAQTALVHQNIQEKSTAGRKDGKFNKETNFEEKRIVIENGQTLKDAKFINTDLKVYHIYKKQ